ncbi:MAG: Uma2 family endonuclease [Selenomonadaceae bacterium]|nr:Uma2 family endonuclease [Selenomonadaceae bacterium]
MLNDALYYKPYEIIGGKKIMSAMAALTHSGIIMNLSNKIFSYVVDNKCGYVFPDNVDVHLPDGNLFRPDLTVITAENKEILNWKGAIRGVPDMVVEVLSPSTRKNDLTIKKDIYEANGVKEYWIVDPRNKTVDVYILCDGKFNFDESYHKYDVDEWELLDDEEKSAVKSEIKVSIFNDLFIKVDDIFSWGYDF